MPETRGQDLVIVEGRASSHDLGSLKNGQLVLVDTEHDPKERGIGELFELHQHQQRTDGLLTNDVVPTHYPLTLHNSQMEPFLPVFQGIKDAPPIAQVTGRILDFTVKEQTVGRNGTADITRFAIADTAHIPAIVKLRQIIDYEQQQGRVSQYADLLKGNGDIVCIWELGTMTLKAVVGTTDVSPIDFLEVEAQPNQLGLEEDEQREDKRGYSYDVTFTDNESYENSNVKYLIDPLLKGFKNPDSKFATEYLFHITKSIFDPTYEPKDKRYKASVDAVMAYLNNVNNPNYGLAPIVSVAHALVRASLLINKINLDEKNASNAKRSRSSSEPTYSEQRKKVWYELMHSFGFDARLHEIHRQHPKLARYYKETHNAEIFNRLRVWIRSHDDIDALIAKYAQQSLNEHDNTHNRATILKSFIAADFNGQRKNGQPNFSLMALSGTQLAVIQDVNEAAEVEKDLQGLIAVSTDTSSYRVVTPPYYPTEVASAFSSRKKEFINTIPGVVAVFGVLLPEITKNIDNKPPLPEELPLEFVATSIKYQPWLVSKFILDSMLGTKEKYHELRQAIKYGKVSWHSIFESPRQQSWTIIGEKSIQPGNPRAAKEVVAIGEPLYNGDAFLIATDDKNKIYTDRGKIAGQKRRVRQLGKVVGKGFLTTDKNIQRPTYSHEISKQRSRHQLEVIFAANQVFAYDGATGSEDNVRVTAPEQWKRVVIKRRKGFEA